MESVEALDQLLASGMDLRARTVWQSIMRELGGADGLAREVKLDLEASPEGSANRVRLLIAVLTGIQKLDATDENDGKSLDELKGDLAAMLKANPELIHEVIGGD